MKKFRFFLDCNKEEKWLNDMSKRGYQLDSISFGYNFKYADGEKYNIKTDYRVFKNQQDFLDYCTLFEDSGWKHVAGSKNSGTQYFRKIDTSTCDDIFSDSFSRAGKYKRLADMWMTTIIIFLPTLFIFFWSNMIRLDAFFNPKTLYYTPNLWEMSGNDFWRYFIFETPLVILRGYAWTVIPISMVLYLYCTVKSWRLYKITLSKES